MFVERFSREGRENKKTGEFSAYFSPETRYINEAPLL